MPRPTDALAALVRPRSVAVVGASADPDKLNGRIVRFLRDKGFPGALYPVNPRATEILGLRCYPTLADVPGPVDLVVIGLAAPQVPDAIRDAGRAGAGAVLVFASGFAEMGEEGRRLQEALGHAAREAGVRLCGPNSVGVVNAYDRVVATFSQIGNNPVAPGPLAFVTQSGALGTVVNTLANRRGLGLGYVVHTGNEADVTAVDAIAAVAADDRVRAVGAYLEGVRDGAALCELAEAMTREGKPLVAVKVGRSAAGARAVASHTGSLATEDRVFADLARQYGILRARNETHLLDLCEGLVRCPPAGTGGVGIVTQSGGTAVLMADRAEELGLPVPELGPATQETLRTFLPSYATVGNPVDASMQAVAEPALLGRALRAVLDDERIGVGIVWLQHMDAKADALVAMFSDLRESLTKPWIVAWAAAPAHAADALRAKGVCVVESAEIAVDIAHALVAHAQARARLSGSRPITLPSLAPPIPGPVPTLAAAAMLAKVGVGFPRSGLARSSEDAVRLAVGFGGPVALKVESPQILHKTEVGGVRLGLREPAEVEEAYAAIIARAREACPTARLEGVVVQAMAPPGVEMVLGLRNDPAFGMLIMLGIGGVFVEVYRDVVFRRLPLTRADASAMLEELRGARLLGPFRGRDAIDTDALVDLVGRVAAFGDANRTWLAELDLNPVIVRPDGALAVDVLMTALPTEKVR